MTADYMTKEGAEGLAKKLTTYWHSSGCAGAKFYVESIGEVTAKTGPRTKMFVVRSNLINAMPPMAQVVRLEEPRKHQARR